MFEVGWSEILLIAVVALIVVGPRDLPDLLRQAGRAVGALKRMAGDFHAQFNDVIRETELDNLRKELNDLRRTAQGALSEPPEKRPDKPDDKASET